MSDTTTNEVTLQPNIYAGGIPPHVLSMPNAKTHLPGTGKVPSNSGQGQGGNSMTMDDNVSLQGPGTQLNGAKQKTDAQAGDDAQPMNPGSEFTGTPPGDGYMLIDWQKINGNEYYLEADKGNGSMVIGWKWINNAKYYFFKDGTMTYGDWLEINGKWYYFHPDGKMAASEISVYSNKKYYLGEDGAMVTKVGTKDKQVTYNGITYSVAEDGVCTAISSLRPANADIEAWKIFIKNDQNLSETRREIVLEGIKIKEQGCKYHQLRSGGGKPSQCLSGGCDHEIHSKNKGKEYNFDTMANYNLDTPLYLDCSFFIKHCYWKAGLEMRAGDTGGLYSSKEFVVIQKENLKPADITVRWKLSYDTKGNPYSEGHVILFVGWTSENKMVWVEMSNHAHDSRFSSYSPDSRFSYKKFKVLND